MVAAIPDRRGNGKVWGKNAPRCMQISECCILLTVRLFILGVWKNDFLLQFMGHAELIMIMPIAYLKCLSSLGLLNGAFDVGGPEREKTSSAAITNYSTARTRTVLYKCSHTVTVTLRQ
jgi:hypothetical protein